jgi:hypothetical protein
MINAGKKCIALLRRGRLSVRSLNEIHYIYIRTELNQARGLIPLLMKHRNGGQWSVEERATLLRDLRALSGLSPYLIPLLMPGGIFMLPLVAYWMDRRRKIRKNPGDKP